MQSVCICNQDGGTLHGCCTAGCGRRQGYYGRAIMAIVSDVGGGGVLSATADGHGGTHATWTHGIARNTHRTVYGSRHPSPRCPMKRPWTSDRWTASAVEEMFSSSSCARVNGQITNRTRSSAIAEGPRDVRLI